MSLFFPIDLPLATLTLKYASMGKTVYLISWYRKIYKMCGYKTTISFFTNHFLQFLWPSQIQWEL